MPHACKARLTPDGRRGGLKFVAANSAISPFRHGDHPSNHPSLTPYLIAPRSRHESVRLKFFAILSPLRYKVSSPRKKEGKKEQRLAYGKKLSRGECEKTGPEIISVRTSFELMATGHHGRIFFIRFYLGDCLFFFLSIEQLSLLKFSHCSLIASRLTMVMAIRRACSTIKRYIYRMTVKNIDVVR